MSKTNTPTTEMRRGPGMGHSPGGMGRPVEKAKDFSSAFKRLLRRLEPFRIRLITVFILAIASTSFTIGAPQIVREAMNRIQDSFMARTVLQNLEPLRQELANTVPQLANLPSFTGNADNEAKAQGVEAILPYIEGAGAINPEQIRSSIGAIGQTGGNFDFGALAVLVGILAGVYLLSAIFTFAMQLVMAGVAQKLVSTLRSEVDAKLDRLPLRFFDGRPHGDVLSRMTNDIDTIANTLQQSLTQMITSVISIIGYILMMLIISPLLTLFVMLTLPLYVLATMAVTKRSQKWFAAQQKEVGALSGHVEEMIGAHKVVKAYGLESASRERFEESNRKLYDAGWRAQYISGVMFPLMNFVSNLGFAIISVAGGMMITSNWLKIGDITAFIQYARNFTMPIVQTANIANIIQSTIACAERVFEILDEEEEIQDPLGLTWTSTGQKHGLITLDKVNFSYSPDTRLIENLDLTVQPGHTVAIVGPTGAGKTTLVNLLLRFYELNGGKIYLGERDVSTMSRAELRSHFGMVLQDTWLFNGTIRDNIAYGRPDASEAEIIAAAEAAHADHFIRTLPEGYATMLNEEASNISQGQKQLLTIARAILADPGILILDEATSSVDTRTEVLIRKAMGNLMADRTSFVIAHRLSTIRDAELIIVMDKGSIVEKGTHTELLEARGFYSDLYKSQFSGKSEPSRA